MAKFEGDKPLGETLTEWWEALRKNKGDRAELRRCSGLNEVILSSAFQKQHRRFRRHFKSNDGWQSSMAMILGVLSHVDDVNAEDFAKWMASVKDNRPRVSELRFRRLLQEKDREKLYPMLIRTVRLVGRTANIHSLADAIFYWGDNVRKRWAYAYYDALPDQHLEGGNT